MGNVRIETARSGVARTDLPCHPTARTDAFLYGKICLNCLADKIDIKDPGKETGCFFGFYVNLLEDTLFAADKHNGPEKTLYFLNKNLSTSSLCSSKPERKVKFIDPIFVINI